MKQYLTDKGRQLLTEALSGGNSITFSKIVLGNGMSPEIHAGLADELQMYVIAGHTTNVLNPQIELPVAIDEDVRYSQCVVLKSIEFANSSIETGFHITEVGVFVKAPDGSEDILYSIGYADESEADYVPDSISESWTATIRQIVYIGDAVNITAVFNSASEFALQEDFSNHVKNNNNPHKVTKAQIGLSEVPNVSTNNQTPTFSVSTDLTEIESGEKLSAIFGKIKMAIRVFIDHLSDKKNPHAVSASQVGAAAKKHTHSVSDINSGTLKVNRGGTGKDYFSTGSIPVGNAQNSMKEIVGIGALFSTEHGKPEYGILPVNLGGTGYDKGVTFSTKADEYGCRGSILLPGGLLVQWGRIKRDKSTNDVDVKFKQEYADTNYALIFSTAGRDYDEASMIMDALPKWRQPQYRKDGFRMLVWKTEFPYSAYSDWVSFGKAAE